MYGKPKAVMLNATNSTVEQGMTNSKVTVASASFEALFIYFICSYEIATEKKPRRILVYYIYETLNLNPLLTRS